MKRPHSRTRRGTGTSSLKRGVKREFGGERRRCAARLGSSQSSTSRAINQVVVEEGWLEKNERVDFDLSFVQIHWSTPIIDTGKGGRWWDGGRSK